MADKDFDLDKILSDSMNRLNKISSEGVNVSDAKEESADDASLNEILPSADVDANADVSEENTVDADAVQDHDGDGDNNSGNENAGGDHNNSPSDEDDGYDSGSSDEDEYYDDDNVSDEDEYYDEDDDFVEEYKDISRRGLQFNMEKEEKPKKRKKKRVKPNNSIFVGTLVAVIVIAISFILSFLSIQFGVEYIGLTRGEENITFDVPNGTNADTIADLLYQKGIIDNPTMFKFVIKLSGKTNIVPGSITLAPNMTYPSIITELNRSRKVYETVTVTFTEGMSLYKASKILEDNGVCTASEFLEAFNDDSGFDFEKGLELTPQTLYMMEGFLFPDTYEFYIEDEPQNVVKKIKSNFENKIEDNMSLVEQSGLSLYEVITLASIVQAEADTPQNMKLVASVFLNRLANKEEFPYLQSDATYFYVTNTIASALGNASVSSYEYLYSTYSCFGLPIGPIGNPGMDAIMAVLQPEVTDYYYFVTDSVTGEFYYASTFEEHEANVKKAGY